MKRPHLSSCKRSVALLALAALVILQLVGCGGGGNYASGGIVGTGDAGRATQGRVTALDANSIVVNGQTFAVAAVPVTINGQASTASALQMGMVVTILSTVRSDGSMAVTSIEYHAEVQGVVTGVDPAAQTFTVLGQRVQTDRLTLYSGGTFDTLLNQVVEVSGFRSTPGDLLATLVIVKPTVPPAKASLQVTGVVAALEPAARTFAIGLQLLDYSGIPPASVPSGLANGATVRADGTQTSPVGTLFAGSIALVTATPPDVINVELEGLITEFVGPGSFKVNGQLTDARNAVIEGGTIDMLGDGGLVDVEGKVTNGVLVATKVKIEQLTVIVLDGLVQGVDTSGSITVGGELVLINASTQFIDSSAAAVQGFSLGAVRVGDRLSVLAFRGETGLVATRVERLNPDAPPPNQPSTSIQGTISNFVSIANFVISGQQINAGTAAFAGGTAGSLVNGVGVAISGSLVNGVLNASLVQFLPTAPPPTSITVTGTVSGFTSASNFFVAGQQVDASSASFSNGAASDLANGRSVTVKGVVQSGTLVAQTVSFAQPPQTTTLEVEGTISSFVSVSNFVVAGQRVNASQASISDGSAGNLANGVGVQVKGVLQNGVLVATTVEIQSSSEPQDTSVKGLITNFVSVSQFTVAGRVVDASNAKFDGGTRANLANGVSVQVQGPLVGGVLKATELEFDD